jgi:hypothetical protein
VVPGSAPQLDLLIWLLTLVCLGAGLIALLAWRVVQEEAQDEDGDSGRQAPTTS